MAGGAAHEAEARGDAVGERNGTLSTLDIIFSVPGSCSRVRLF
jgi:hypothetical protein